MIALDEIPPAFLAVPYVGSRVPGTKNPGDLAAGANCQLFAYQLLRHFGRTIPDFRSSELWADESRTVRVDSFEPLDLMLYHEERKAWGAHVGLYLGEDRVIHLSKAVGRPAIWRHGDFAAQARYACFIGAKRLLS